MPVFDPAAEGLKTAHRIRKVMAHSTKIGAASGAAYNVGKVGYYRARQKLTKDPKKKKGYGLMAKGTAQQLPRHVATGAMWGYASKYAAGPLTVGGIKAQNVYHMAAHKAGRFKRRAEKAGMPGFDPRGFPIKPRKAPKAKKVSAFLQATNESKDEWRKYAKWSSKAKALDTKLKARQAGREKLKGIAVKAGTDTLRTKKAFSPTPRNSREALLKAVATKLTTGKSDAPPEKVQAADKVASKIFSRPMVTSAEAKDQVAATIKKRVKGIKKTDFTGHGRSLGKNEEIHMKREELIEKIIEGIVRNAVAKMANTKAKQKATRTQFMRKALIRKLGYSETEKRIAAVKRTRGKPLAMMKAARGENSLK
jgi:hypothetical protein